jgi:hypothetical protein
MNLFMSPFSPTIVETPHRAAVANAARLFRIGEFQFLQLAFSEWFSKEMTEDIINEQFRKYMMNNEVPHWALHCARNILSLSKNDNLH